MGKPDSVETQEELAVALTDVINGFRTGDQLTYATIIGVLRILEDMLLAELEEEYHEQNINNTSILKAVTARGQSGTAESDS
jgi:hypothetical protein